MADQVDQNKELPFSSAPVQFVDGELRINPRNRAFWDNPELLAHYQHQLGFWSTDDASHVIFHETAHAAYYNSFRDYLRNSKFGETYPELIESAVHRGVDEIFKMKKLSDVVSPALAQKILDQVGRHAMESLSEFVAEVFTGMLVGRKYDEEIMNLYRSNGAPSV